MTDRYKGFIVHLEKDIREDDAESVIMALRMIKRVAEVSPIIAAGEDDIAYSRGRREIMAALYEFMRGQM